MEIAEQNYANELKKATYFVKEIADSLNIDVKEDLLLAQEKIWETNKTLESSDNAVKEVMLDTEKSLEEVRAKWNVPKTGVVVILKGKAKDRALWKVEWALETFTGKKGKVRVLKLKQ